MPPAQPDTSLSLLQQLGGGAEDAWRRLVALYTPLLRVWLRSANLQAADVDDLTQRALEILLRRLPQFAHNGRPGAFRAWLRSIAVNLLREFWRGRPPAGSDSVLDELADPDSSLSHQWDQEHDRHILHALFRLVRPEFTASTWRAFQRTALDGTPARTAAAELAGIATAVQAANQQIAGVAAARSLPLLDLFALSELAGGPLTLGGVTLTPDELFAPDLFHPGTILEFPLHDGKDAFLVGPGLHGVYFHATESDNARGRGVLVDTTLGWVFDRHQRCSWEFGFNLGLGLFMSDGNIFPLPTIGTYGGFHF